MLSGSLVRRPAQAAVAGAVACELAVAAHYGVGRLIGVVPESVWADNRLWLVAAVVLGAPLGIVGLLGRRSDGLGLLSRLVVPAGAMIEPLAVGMFSRPASASWPDQLSSTVSGAVLMGGGAALVWVQVARTRRVSASGRR